MLHAGQFHADGVLARDRHIEALVCDWFSVAPVQNSNIDILRVQRWRNEGDHYTDDKTLRERLRSQKGANFPRLRWSNRY